MKKTTLAIVMILVFAASCGYAEEKFPKPRGFVSDFANILPEKANVELNALFSDLEAKTTAEIAVVTVDSTSPLDIETYAVELFQKWGIGKKGKDNGVLLLVAVKDRKVRIEVGYGLEGAIPDALSERIISTKIIPFFKKGDYVNGILNGSLAVAQLTAKEYNVKLSSLKQIQAVSPPKPAPAFAGFLKIFLMLIFIFGFRFSFLFLPLMFGGTRRRGGSWFGTGYGGSAGGFSGGFGGFGGGLSGGGGASGGW